MHLKISMLYSLFNLKYDFTSLLILNVDAIDEKILQDLKKNVALELGQQIRKIRKKKRLSQSDLAFLVGMDRQYLYKIETARVTPNIGTIAGLAFALDISLTELFQNIYYEENKKR